MSSAYIPLNPFIDASVGEAELWGARDWLDVPHIHAKQSADLATTVATVRSSRRTQVRFVRGSGGSGKSHLFTRLRRQFADTIFYAYAANPPLQPGTLEGFVLGRLIASLRHPARLPDGAPAPYSQIRLLGYALLKPTLEQDVSLHDLHDSWAEIALEDRKELLHEALLLLETDHPEMPRSVLRALLTVLREDKEHLAAQWMAGATYLTESDLKYLGVPEPLRREDCGLVIQLLGRLAARVGLPFVLVIDQLDLVSAPTQLDEFQRLIFSLIDQSENWAVFIGLVAERFAAWDGAMSQALRGRIGVPDANAQLGFRLPVTDVPPIGTEDKKALLNSRLSSRALQNQRLRDGITQPIHPLTSADFERLISGGPVFPRHLLAAASEAFTLSATAESQPATIPPASATSHPTGATIRPPASTVQTQIPSKQPLAAKVDELLRESMFQSGSGDNAAESAVILGQRIKDLIEVMVPTPVELREGDMEKSYPGFDGADFSASWGGGQVRIVTTDAVRNKLIAVLERLQPVPSGTLLVRHFAAPLAGQLTLEMLTAFRQKNTFHHLPASESVILAAVGRLLATMREGNHSHHATEPPPTPENIIHALRQHPLLLGLKTWELITRIQEPKSPLSAIVQGTTATSNQGNGAHAATPAVKLSGPVLPPTMIAAPPPPVVPLNRPPLSTPVAKPLSPSAKPVAKPIRPPQKPLPPPS